TAVPEVARHVSKNVRQLERNAEVHGVVTGAIAVHAEDLDADKSHGRRHTPAVFVELLERLITLAIEVHLHAVYEVLERCARQREPTHPRLKGPPHVRGGRSAIAPIDFAPPFLQARADVA